MVQKLAAATRKLMNYVNNVVWVDEKIDPVGTTGFFNALRTMVAERGQVLFTPEFLELKNAIEKA
jgi:hypothetical protein